MAGTFRVAVVTPEREVAALEAKFVALPAFDGEMGILAKRAPLLTQLGSGLLRIEGADGSKRRLFVSGGFAQMVEDKLTVLTPEALEPADVTAEAARAGLDKAAALPSTSDAEAEKKQRAYDRARALGRAAR
jgi:F-type H+-transporting ATPase subunit epsilon